jgi:hypothetical protein
MNDTGMHQADRITSDGRINISNLDSDATWQYSLNAGSSWIEGSGNSLNFTNAGDGHRSLLVKVTDIAGNVKTSDEFSFTLDKTAPLLTSITPSNASTNVALNADIVFNFNENVYRTLNTIPLYWVSQYGDTLLETFSIEATNKISISGGRFTLNPSYDLNFASQYKLNLPEGFVQDLAGNTATTTYANYSFITRDTNTVVNPGGNNTSLVVGTVIDPDFDGYGLYKTTAGSYIIDIANLTVNDNTDSPLTLKTGAKAYAPKTAPSALLIYSDGTYGVIAGSGNAWTEQKFNGAGVSTGTANKLNLTQVLEKEKAFTHDINGDGTIGDEIATVYDSGVEDGYGLYKTVSGFYVIDIANLEVGDTTDVPLALRTGARDFTAKVDPSALLVYNDLSFGLISGSGVSWSEIKFNSAGASGLTTKLNLSQLLEKEKTFLEDINRDGVIGDKVTAVYDSEAEDDYGLYKTMSGSIIIDSAYLEIDDVTDSPMTLKLGTKNYVPKVAPTSLLVYGDGSFGVIAGSGLSWTEQKFNSAGFGVGSAAKLNLMQILEKENTFLEDINGDGFVGDPIASVLDNDGYLTERLMSYGLYRSQITKSYYIDETEMTVGLSFTDTALKIKTNATTAWTPSSATVLGIAEKESGYLEILMKAGAIYTAQKVDIDTGLVVGAATKINAANLDAREYFYDVDLNGINGISLAGLTSFPSDWDS